jgi:hypothetical protein
VCAYNNRKRGTTTSTTKEGASELASKRAREQFFRLLLQQPFCLCVQPLQHTPASAETTPLPFFSARRPRTRPSARALFIFFGFWGLDRAGSVFSFIFNLGTLFNRNLTQIPIMCSAFIFSIRAASKVKLA